MNKQAKLKQDQDVAKDDLTIILSYPHVYRFKPICYGMIVAVLNCHSSVITIMEKNDNILCINYTIKTGTVREQVHGGPGVGEVQTWVCARPLRGCGDVYPLCWMRFYALFLHLFRRKRSFYI